MKTVTLVLTERQQIALLEILIHYRLQPDATVELIDVVTDTKVTLDDLVDLITLRRKGPHENLP